MIINRSRYFHMNKFLYKLLIITVAALASFTMDAQSFKERYQAFKQEKLKEYASFRDECNRKYVDLLRGKWDISDKNPPMPEPKEDKPIPPRPYEEEENDTVTVVPIDIQPVEEIPQPQPIEPIYEDSLSVEEYFVFDFYGVQCKVRMPECARLDYVDNSEYSIADAWLTLSGKEMNNAIRDCLEIRENHNLCDWAFLMLIDRLCNNFCQNQNGANVLKAFICCQSGYNIRIGIDQENVVMLFGSRHQIYSRPYFVIEGVNFYPLSDTSGKIKICNAEFEGSTPVSLTVTVEQYLGDNLSEVRNIKSKRYPDLKVDSRVQESLIEFYDKFPSSEIGNNYLTRWAMYANTPLSTSSRECLYPAFRSVISSKSEKDAVDMILNWVQTGFEYEYDEKVWGEDRAFFAEESLYYKYCDCEDRSILFSRIVRDLLGLKVALVYYPGHLATAVRFTDGTDGDAIIIDNEKYVVCDPTYIGAPVGKQMPGLDYEKAAAIVLR